MPVNISLKTQTTSNKVKRELLLAFLKLIPTFLALEICILPIWPSIQILFAYLAFPSALVEGTVNSQGRLTRNDTISLLSLFYSVTH